MSLGEKVLRSINDTLPIYSHADRSAALKAFLNAYDEQTKLDGTIPVLTPTTTGRELKDAFSMLEVDAQLAMLTAYWNTIHGKSSESLAAAEERKHKHWLIKFGVVFIGGVVLVVTGMVLTIATKDGKVDNALVASLLSAAGEILKVAVGLNK